MFLWIGGQNFLYGKIAEAFDIDIDAYIENIYENGPLEIGLSENNEYVFQSFTIRASRKRLRRLKEIPAYNVGQCLSSDSDIEKNKPH